MQDELFDQYVKDNGLKLSIAQHRIARQIFFAGLNKGLAIAEKIATNHTCETYMDFGVRSNECVCSSKIAEEIFDQIEWN